MPELKFLVFDRADTKLAAWVDILPSDAAESGLLAKDFRRQELPSGKLFIHRSADRLLSLKPTIDLLTFLASQLSDSSLEIDLSLIPSEKLREYAIHTMLGAGFGVTEGDGRMHAKVQVKAVPVIWIEKDGKLSPIQCFSSTEPKRDADRGALLEVRDLARARRDTGSVVGPRRWGLGIVGPLTRLPGQEAKFGKLILELGELTDVSVKKVSELQASLSKRVFAADPWARQLNTIQQDQSWASLPQELKDRIIKSGYLHGLESPVPEDALEGAKIHRVVPGFGVSVRHEKGPGNSYGGSFTFMMTPW